MKAGGIDISYEVGDSYKPIARMGPDGPDIHSPDPEERHDARQAAVEEFRKNAILISQTQMEQALVAAIGFCIQIRALGGHFIDEKNLKIQLQETIDFMEEL